MSDTQVREGWTYLWNSPRWHYFREGRALCGGYLLLGNPQLEPDQDSPSNCKACWRKRQKELEKAGVR